MADASLEKPMAVMAGIKMLSSALGVQFLYLVMSYVNGLQESAGILFFEALCLSIIMGGLIYSVSSAQPKARLLIGATALFGFGFAVFRFTQHFSSEGLIFVLSFVLTAGSLVFLFRQPASEWFKPSQAGRPAATA